jgi:class 3 adenylate cyclase/pimeloyl-ACP methyl ester carboxylesterase
MICPACGKSNASDARFCSGCGVRLGSVCLHCSRLNEPDSRFCSGCGRPLEPASVARQSESIQPRSYTPVHLAERILTSRAALEGERKQVTVLFADLKGSLELLAERDPEEARALLDPILERLMEAVHRYEGTVNQVMGDGIMALFGAPLALEDHAVRACYAALRMQESVREYAVELRRTQGVLVQIRVGLNSGEVVVRTVGSDLRMDYSAVGQTTHLAARMEQLAPPGTTLMSASTFAFADGYVLARALGPVAVKGLAEPVETYELTGASAVRTRLQAAAARGLSRFIGRADELGQLRRSLERAGRGQGQALAVVGEAGVGKSRLFHEFCHATEMAGWLLLESRSVSYGRSTSYLPLIDLLKGYLHIQDRDDPRSIRERISGKLVTLDQALMPVLPALLALFELPVEDAAWQALDPPQRRRHTIDACKRLLLRESQMQPLVLVFEDLHWIDLETQAFLDSLVESLPSARMLLLVNYRPEYRHTWGGKTYYSQVRIDPLPTENARALLATLLGDDPELAGLKERLIERTQGNPFFLEESVQALRETGVLSGPRGDTRLARPTESIHPPVTVHSLLAARIDRLGPEDKALLQTAAVIGKDVPLALLQAVADLGEDELRGALERLRSGEFLYEANLFPELDYTFKHALTHEVAYAGVLSERRKALHGRIVSAIEAVHSARLAEHAERLAAHASAAALWPQAARYSLQAAQKAKDRYAYATAIEACTRAVGAAERAGRPNEEAEALVLLGDLHSLCGNLAEANSHYDRASELTNDPPRRRLIANKRHRQHTLSRNGRIVFYERGRGEQTLVFCTPLVYGAALQPVTEELCQDFHVVTIDPRGVGASDPLPGSYGLLDHVEDVRAVIEALGSGPVFGIGLSRGGNLLVRLAVAYPQLLKGLVTIGTPNQPVPPHDPRYREAIERQDIEQMIRLLWAEVVSEPGSHDVAELHIEQALRLPRETILSFYAPDPARDIVSVLPEIRVPTLVVHGTEDRRVPFEEGRQLAARIPQARLYPMVGFGHLPLFTARQAFCAALREFVNRVCSQERLGDFPDP